MYIDNGDNSLQNITFVYFIHVLCTNSNYSIRAHKLIINYVWEQIKQVPLKARVATTKLRLTVLSR